METSLNDMSETNELNEVNNTVEAELTGLTDHSDENTDKRFSEEVNLSGLKGLLNQTFHLTKLACLYIVRVAYQCCQTVL